VVAVTQAITMRTAAEIVDQLRAGTGRPGGSHEVLCGFGCGYLADSEADLDDHETRCDHAELPMVSDLPAPRPTTSIRLRRGGDR
jgi:hypothetical protein